MAAMVAAPSTSTDHIKAAGMNDSPEARRATAMYRVPDPTTQQTEQSARRLQAILRVLGG